MATFCTAIRRDSVSLLRFPFLSQFHIFSREMWLVSYLKPPKSFSSQLRFLIMVILLILALVLLLVAVISLHPRFSMLSSGLCIKASTLSSMLASPFPPSFHDAYSLSTSSLGCKTFCIVISFLVLWSTSRMVSNILRVGQPSYLSVW